ncbi:MAG: hypothetical protein KJ615_00885, partial [Bacteroidetes bacterium]|nr:hypothetical protein [Bacteroidota bacterium]
YKGFKIEQAMQLDFVIEDIIPLNLTTKQENLNWEDMHTILRFSDFPLGISLNISETQLIDGFKKIQNPLIRKI